MLIEFQTQNFRSYRDKQEFSFVASAANELPKNILTLPELGDLRILKSAVVYGANASGKSNLLRAVAFARNLVLQSGDTRRAGQPMLIDPFLLDEESAEKPSHFEWIFVSDNVRYQYGFSISATQVEREWLYAFPHRISQLWFDRECDSAGVQSWKFGDNFRGEKQRLANLTRPNALYLSVGAQLNHSQLSGIYRWFQEGLRVNLRGESQSHDVTLQKCVNDQFFRAWLPDFLANADLGINGIQVRKLDANEIKVPFDVPEEVRLRLLKSLALEGIQVVETIRRLDGDRKVIWPINRESDGTQRMFQLVGPWIQAIERGSTILVDELDTSLHPFMTRKLVEMFNNSSVNRMGAQLLFTTHDTTLLDSTLFRRDQVWFTEKEKTGATHLYSLQDYHPRKGEALQKGYLAGRYGAIPFLGEFKF